ncbi:MAG: AI-2E family transporter [Actinobacteria bacterium]|nr:MAG: AI-2E family transporter [Actinomycetota bacterium]
MSNSKKSATERFQKMGIISWSIIGLAGVSVIIYYLLSAASVVVPLLFYSAIIIYVLRPVVEYFCRLEIKGKRMPRIIAVTITYIIVAIIVFLLLLYFVPIIARQSVVFTEQLSTKFYPAAIKAFNKFASDYQSRFKGTAFDIQQYLDSIFAKLRELGGMIANGVLKATSDIFTNVLYVFIAPILAFFILKDLPLIRQTQTELIPSNYRQNFLEIVHMSNQILAGFLKGSLLTAAIVAVLSIIWLAILGVPFEFVIGILVGLLSIIPYFGGVIGVAIAAIVALFMSPVTALLVIIGLFVVIQIGSVLISPLVMKKQVNLHPVVVVLALLIGGSLYGFLGLLLSIPAAAILKSLIYYFIAQEENY